MKTLHAFALLLTLMGPVSCKSNTIDNSTTNAGTQSVIGAAGGTVNGPDGTSVRIPANALKLDTTISITVAEPGQYPVLPDTYNLQGNKVYAFQPHGLQFQSPAIITLPITAPDPALVGIRADPNGAWATTNAQFAVDAQLSVPSFSFYAVAKPVTGGSQDAGSCSGRGPDNSARVSTVTNGQGTALNVDFAELKSAHAAVAPEPTKGTNLNLILSTGTNVPGEVVNDVRKIGTKRIVIQFFVESPTLATGSYSAAGSPMLDASDFHMDNSTGEVPGECRPFTTPRTTGASAEVLNITAIDENHVEGSFSVFVAESQATVSATFNATRRDIVENPSTKICCIP